jgi:tetratricopeptide (TPR) repeat protein
MRHTIFHGAAVLLACGIATASVADDRPACTAWSTGDKAIAACSRLIVSNARDAEAYKYRGDAYSMIKSDYVRAIADYDQAIRIDPSLAAAYVGRGSAYYGKADYDHALADYDQAIRFEPKNALALTRRGDAHHHKGDDDHALADLDQAIRLDPKSAYAYNFRGVVYRDKGDYDRAVADFDQAIRLEPRFTGHYDNLGILYHLKGDYDRAIATLDQAIGINPKDGGAFLNRGIAWSGKGDYGRAVADFDQAVRLNTQNAETYSYRGFAYGRKGEFDRAMTDLDKAIALDPKYARGYAHRAAVLELRGDADRAIADADEAIQLDPKDGVPYNWRGKAWFDKGDYDRAIADYDRAIRFAPSLADARRNRDQALAALATSQPPRTQTASPAATPGPSTQTPGSLPQAASPAGPERRVALVIGNSQYRSVPALANPQRDARAVANALQQVGFQSVELALDVDRAGMMKVLRSFRDRADHADWALVYFAGHGIEIDRANYLIPIDATLLDDRDVKAETVSYDDLAAAVGNARALRLVVLDACRNNPFKERMHRNTATRSATDRGLAAPPEAEPGTLVVYSAKEGEVAADGADGINSPFARAFIAQIKVPGREIRRLFDLVRDDVMDATDRRQQPYTYGSLPGRRDFYFVAGR